MYSSLITKLLGGRMLGDDVFIDGIAPLYCAQRSHISLVLWPPDILRAKKSNAGCIICDLKFAANYADQISCTLIVIDDFYKVFKLLRNWCDLGKFGFGDKIFKQNISQSAVIHKSSIISCSSIGDKTIIGPNVFIDDDVVIGAGCHIAAGSIIFSKTRIADNSNIGAGSVIGSSAFAPYGLNPSRNLSSLGFVEIAQNVDIHARCTIDRGVISKTIIGEHSLIDNMVHVGHDVIIGKNVIIAAQTGFAGFVQIGDDVTIGGQCGFVPHITVGDKARISGKSMVHCDVKALEIWSGNPSVPHEIYLRNYKRNLQESRKYDV